MVQEQPPRRSKADKDPVTIDLTPEESRVVSEPVRSNDSDETAAPDAPLASAANDAPLASAANDAPHEQGGEAASSTASETPPLDHTVAETPLGQETLMEQAALPGHEPEPATLDSKPTGTKGDWKPEPSSFEPEPSHSYEREPSASPRAGSSVPAMVASGIFGGLVALFLAGSMQYAGYLPAASSDDSRNASSAPSPELDALRQEIEALKQRPAGDEPLTARIQALEQAQASSGASEEMQQRFASLEKQLQDVRSATQATASSDAGLARRLNEAEAKINDRGPEQQVARAVAAAALKAAIDRGGPFEPELQTFANVAADDPVVAQLHDFAASGVPSRAELQRDFSPAADAMLEAAEQPAPNQGLAARLFSSAASVVKVRQVGQVEGSTPEAVVARIENAVRDGDLAAAAREWSNLPEPAKAAGQDFKRKLDARVQVEDLVNGTLTRAVAGTKG
ncbi:hypothetical protein EPK99_22015 [Neorhizobium lilium]|uniref:Inner membrane protein n=1 Tax=Neorhizobium lilium TaxID=2503024 RepID=A0A3S3SUJ6_9HYPH|nr:mitofilin family membrane protein [Neorhizobium lilium]RWX75143.1 hypothetical protein EPK99_22015 [Neorhizobium lilium]